VPWAHPKASRGHPRRSRVDSMDRASVRLIGCIAMGCDAMFLPVSVVMWRMRLVPCVLTRLAVAPHNVSRRDGATAGRVRGSTGDAALLRGLPMASSAAIASTSARTRTADRSS
jgi:hypothetical protein